MEKNRSSNLDDAFGSTWRMELRYDRIVEISGKPPPPREVVAAFDESWKSRGKEMFRSL